MSEDGESSSGGTPNKEFCASEHGPGDEKGIDLPPPEALPQDKVARALAFSAVGARLFGSLATPTLGRYELEKVIGEGAMGVVYKAYDPKLKRHVALKKIGEAWDRKEAEVMRSALQRDAQASARLQHSNVVEVYDCGLEGEEFYMVMELVDGVDLSQWLSDRQRSWREIVKVFIQAGRGLAAAHAHGLVHRDFKPSNVLLGDNGQVRVADFGLARTYAPTSSPLFDHLCTAERLEVSLAESQGLVGTPNYMSPEHFGAGRVTALSDQFAFCVSLYRALFSQFPFEGKTLQERAVQVTRGHIRPPGRHHRVPHRLVQSIMRGLDPRPEHRHESMARLIALLERITQRRSRMVWASSIATMGLGALIGLVVPRGSPDGLPCEFNDSLWTPELESRLVEHVPSGSPEGRIWTEQGVDALRRYARAWDDSRHRACEATRVRSEQSDEQMDLRMACLVRHRVGFTSILDRVDHQTITGGHEVVRLVKDLSPVAECEPHRVRERASWVNPWRTKTDRSRSPQTEQKWQELYARVVDARQSNLLWQPQRAYDEAVAVEAEAHEYGLRYLRAQALLLQGESGFRLSGSEGDLQPLLSAANDAFRLAINVGGWGAAVDALLLEVKIRTVNGHLNPEVERRLEMAYEFALRSGGADERFVRVGLMHARMLSTVGRGADALAICEWILDWGERSPGLEDRAMLVVANELAFILRQEGRPHEAEQTWRWLRGVFRRRYPFDQMLPQIVVNLGLIERDRGNFDAARALYLEALTILDEQTRCTDIDKIKLRKEIATEYRRSGDVQSSSRLLHRVLIDLQEGHDPMHPMVASVLDQLIEVELIKRDFDEAARLADQQLEFASALHPPDHHEVFRGRMMVAVVDFDRGEIEPARVALLQLYRMRDAFPGAPELYAEVAFYYAKALHASGAPPAEFAEPVTVSLSLLEHLPYASSMVREWANKAGLTI